MHAGSSRPEDGPSFQTMLHVPGPVSPVTTMLRAGLHTSRVVDQEAISRWISGNRPGCSRRIASVLPRPSAIVKGLAFPYQLEG
jgi:hypothetical protein